jgi:hypothetical protein
METDLYGRLADCDVKFLQRQECNACIRRNDQNLGVHAMSNDKRNGHLVESKVQRALLRRLLWQWCVFTGLLFTLVIALHYLMQNSAGPQATVFGEIWQRYSLLIIVTLGLVPYFLYDMIRLTHRVAGPMVRFGNVLRRAAQGESVEPVQFRKSDYWQELAHDLNIVLARLQSLEGKKAADRPAADSKSSPVEDSAELITI